MNLPQPPNRWDIEQIMSDRAEAVAARGFTERQARFLVTVMLHSGVFVERQYCTFSNIVHGQKTADFLRKLQRLAVEELDARRRGIIAELAALGVDAGA